MLDDFHRLSGASARESVAWFVAHLPSTIQLVLATRTDPGLPLGALRARAQLLELRADELRFTVAEAGEFLNGRLGLDLVRRRRRAARRAHRGVARRPLPGRALAGGQGGQAQPRHGLRRHEHARRGLPLQRGARRLRAGAADVHAPHVGARAPLRAAVRRGARAAGRRPARWSRSRARTSSWSRSTATAGGSASTTSSRASCGWSWSGASPGSSRSCTGARSIGTAQSGTTDEAIHHAVSAHAFREAGS